MKLIKATMNGFGRLLSASVNLNEHVVAVVGANEAGKSTLLDALAFADREGKLAPAQAAYGRSPAQVSVGLEYVVEGGEGGVIESCPLIDRPTRLSMTKSGNGERSIALYPPPRYKVPSRVSAAVSDLRRVATDRATVVSAFEVIEADHPEETPDLPDLADELIAVVSKLPLAGGKQTDTHGQGVQLFALKQSVIDLTASIETYLSSSTLLSPLRVLRAWVSEYNSLEEMAIALWRRTPEILLFSEGHRELDSTYHLTEALVDEPSTALMNLARTAKLDLVELLRAADMEDGPRKQTLIKRANAELRRAFSATWRQSSVGVQLVMEGALLHVYASEDDDEYSRFESRSAGLRIYAALVCFLSGRGSGGGRHPVVLLIDEAELHLHWDAQADLVESFSEWSEAAKIIYTTHSPACLPGDLGTGIRVVRRSGDETDRSDISASFWEGATEMLLLPTLIREASGLSKVGYQVAGGLSEAPAKMYADLDLEAPRVAYLVDGDSGGVALRQHLTGNGVSPTAVVVAKWAGIENALVAERYLGMYVRLIGERNAGIAIPSPPPLPRADGEVSWSSTLDRWARGQKLNPPGKTYVVQRLLQEGGALLSQTGMRQVMSVDAAVASVLGVPR